MVLIMDILKNNLGVLIRGSVGLSENLCQCIVEALV